MNFLKKSSKCKGLLKFDPRSILLMLFFCNIAIFQTLSIKGEGFLMMSILLLGILAGTFFTQLKIVMIYICLLLVDIVCMEYGSGDFALTIAIGSRYMRKIFPCGLLASILMATITVSEFMAALTKMKAPKSMIVPLTILLRYFPTISEDRTRIVKALKVRGITTGIKGFFQHPYQTIECIYVPLMMSASRRADELSMAAITRGIENPKPRTSVEEVRFKIGDFIGIVLFLVSIYIGGRI